MKRHDHRRWLLLAALLAGGCASAQRLEVTLAHGGDVEQHTRIQLQRLLGAHDLSPWLYTRRVVIDRDAIPHSHPRLTLHARHLRQDDLLLSTFLHEQLHWLLDEHPTATAAAVAELKGRYASLPVGHPDGARSLRSSYEHLLVISLELAAVRRLLGPARAAAVLAFWKRDHYRRLYEIVGQDGERIEAIRRAHGLAPGGL